MSNQEIVHFSNRKKAEINSVDFMPTKEKVVVLLTCGASCPDAVIEEILRKLVSFFPDASSPDEVVQAWEDSLIGS